MDSKKIRENGWIQGAIFGGQENAEIADHLPHGVQPQPTDCLIIVSHSCDVLNVSEEKEPTVELCIARPCKQDNGKLHGKNSRFLHLPIQKGATSECFEIHAKDRYAIPRKILVAKSADRTRKLDGPTIETLRYWLAGRYIRAAFPDAFNARVKAALNRVRQRAKQISAVASSIFLSIEPPEDELVNGENYSVSIFGAIPDDIYENNPDSRKDVSAFISKMAEELGACDGIIVEEFDARLESEISLQDMRYLRKLDFDDLSFKDDSPRNP